MSLITIELFCLQYKAMSLHTGELFPEDSNLSSRLGSEDHGRPSFKTRQNAIYVFDYDFFKTEMKTQIRLCH